MREYSILLFNSFVSEMAVFVLGVWSFKTDVILPIENQYRLWKI